jgi:hypothetical protein
MSEEEFTKVREDIPPVLPVSGSDTSSGGAEKGGAAAPVVTTVGEAGASLTERLDTWQASNMPEEKTYFSCDVSVK